MKNQDCSTKESVKSNEDMELPTVMPRMKTSAEAKLFSTELVRDLP